MAQDWIQECNSGNPYREETIYLISKGRPGFELYSQLNRQKNHVTYWNNFNFKVFTIICVRT